MRAFLVAMFLGGLSLGIEGGGWWNKLQAKAAETAVVDMMPQVIGAELAILVGMLTAVVAAGALFVGRGAESQTPSSGEHLVRPPPSLSKATLSRATPSKAILSQAERIRAALDEGRSIWETARLLKVSVAEVSAVEGFEPPDVASRSRAKPRAAPASAAVIYPASPFGRSATPRAYAGSRAMRPAVIPPSITSSEPVM